MKSEWDEENDVIMLDEQSQGTLLSAALGQFNMEKTHPKGGEP